MKGCGGGEGGCYGGDRGLGGASDLHPEMDPNETDVSAFSHDWQSKIESQLRDLGNTSSSLLNLLSLGGTKTTKIREILVLARDRLLGSYKVKPVIKMLKQTLVGTGALLVSAFVLFVFATPVEDFFKTTLRATNEVSISRTNNNKFNMRKEQLLRLPIDLVTNDDLAAAAAEAADGRPVYCRDRYYRALAGGQYCKWEDLVK
ncbi:hypothetical protein F2Q69_00040222 [Brassica cretica]|uniref:Uncharacterized protein n=1 Tax=Brassica cretica TaxID=69181 RepID=A0A8S9NII8_BRACR|nr:hypothetical protein F2Q69_00040222 [Brassica cretica]